MIYVTSDLHGKFDCLKKLLEKACFSDQDWLYIIGDVIDRHNKGGVDILYWLLLQSNVQLILGNHENFILENRWLFSEVSDENLDSLNERNMSRLSTWRSNGGDVTIENLSRLSPETRQDILDYLDDCPLVETVRVNGRNYVLAHGGLGHYAKSKRLSDYTPKEILWERPSMMTVYDPINYTVIVGHTPTCAYGERYRNRMIKSDQGWWNIDTGAALADGHPMLLCLDTLKEYYMEDDGSVTER